MKITNHYSKIYISTDYEFNESEIKTVGDIKRNLEKILKNLPEDDSLEVNNFYAREDMLGYELKDGIPHPGTMEEETI